MKLLKTKKKSIIIILAIVSFIIITVSLCGLFLIGSTASPSTINLTNIKFINDTTFEIEVSTTSSAKAITNIKATPIYTAGNVYLKVKEVVVSKIHNSGNYKKSFGFNQNALGTSRIKAIYLMGKDINDVKKIWESN